MKILIVSDSFPPLYTGVSKYAWELSENLSRRGHCIEVLTGGWTGYPKNYRFCGVTVNRVGRLIKIPANGTYCWITFGRDIFSETKKIISRGFDIVHMMGPLGLTLPYLATVYSKTTNVGTFLSYVERNPAFFLFKPFLRYFYNKLLLKIAISSAAEISVKKYFGGNFTIIPPGVDIERFRNSDKRFQDEKKKNILFVGRLDERKGTKVLISAFLRLKRKDTRLIIVGDGPMRKTLENRYKHSLDKVIFTGSVSEEDLPSFYSSAYFCVFPSKGGESFGIVIAEAFAAGKTVIASNIQGYKEVVKNGYNGLLFENKNIDELAEKMEFLLSNPEYVKSLEEGASKSAELYSWKKIISQIENSYTRIKSY